MYYNNIVINILHIFIFQRFANLKNFFQRFFQNKSNTKQKYSCYKERMSIIIYTSKFINIISLIVSIIIYVFISFFINYIDFTISKVHIKVDLVSEENLNQNNNQNLNQIEKNTIVMSENNKETQEWEWYIQIDKISLKAPIEEGTTQSIMENYVGHFEETSTDLGNVGLAAHNRGYKNNYFSRIKELQEGDEIIYKYKNIEKRYKVTKQEIIKNTDWSNLEETEENTITLITCVENEPEYRRCIQGIEK